MPSCLRNVDASFFRFALLLINALATRITPRSNIIRAAGLVTAGLFLGISPGSFFTSSDIASSEFSALPPPLSAF